MMGFVNTGMPNVAASAETKGGEGARGRVSGMSASRQSAMDLPCGTISGDPCTDGVASPGVCEPCKA